VGKRVFVLGGEGVGERKRNGNGRRRKGTACLLPAVYLINQLEWSRIEMNNLGGNWTQDFSGEASMWLVSIAAFAQALCLSFSD
jgi:hypothetical protein